MEEKKLSFPGSLCPIPGTLAQAIVDFISSAPFVIQLCETKEKNSFTDFINQTKDFNKPLPFLSMLNIDVQCDDIQKTLMTFIENYLFPISSLKTLFNFGNDNTFSPNIIKFPSPESQTPLTTIDVSGITFNLFSFIINEAGQFNVMIINDESSFFNLETNQLVHTEIQKFNIVAFLYTLENRSVPTLPQIKFFPHATGTPQKTIVDNPILCLSQNIKKNDTYNIQELLLKIDDISYKEGRHLGVKDKKDRFRATCPENGCQGCVIGTIKNDTITISKVHDHSCLPTGYFMNKETKKELSYSTLYNSKILSQAIHKNEYFIAKSTLYRFFEDGSSTAKFDIDWKKLQSYIDHFANEDRSNILFHTIIDDEMEIIDKFFIFPIEGITFLNSNAFFGFLVVDGTFLNYCDKGNMIIFTTCTGNHEIIPIAYGFCPSENCEDISDFLEVIKRNIPEQAIKVFISDEGQGIKAAIRNTFPKSKHMFCYIHKKSHLHGKAKRIFERATNAKNKEDYNSIISDISSLPQDEQEKLRLLCEKYSPLFNENLTQCIITNGICESINSTLKRDKNNTILDDLDLLYDTLRTKCENIPFVGQYTEFIDTIKRSFIAPANSEIVSISKKDRSNKVDVCETINLQDFRFTVIKMQDSFKCSCYWNKHMGCGCRHIFHTLNKYHELGSFDQTIHPGYRKEVIVNFQESLPERMIPENLRINPNHKSYLIRNMKKYKGKRSRCSLDYNK